jgi:cytochrome d ubiquinol oxidase subunit I
MPDALLLSRLQFAANISFHILFPMITIGLAWVLLFFKLRFNATGDDKWMNAYRFWVKVFALTFALGVVSGITMSFQFGTNWPGFMNTVGNVAGPLLAYEVLTAFFLEATFLGIMLFGFKRVGNRMHTVATVLVAVGTSLSAFWILALISWMHTPTGFEMRDGVAHVTSWMEVIFNPSFGYRMIHTMLASFLTGAFLIIGLSAYRMLRDDITPAVQATLRLGIIMAAVLTPLQIFTGDLHGLNTLEHQPAKVAAMEALWETQRGAPLVLFGLPDAETQSNKYAIELPGIASLILVHDMQGEVKGIDAFPGAHPPVAPVFWAFRVMVGTGILMLLISWAAAWSLKRKNGLSPLLLKGLVVMTFSGWAGVLAGWYTTEIGRQPFLVTGVLRTADAVTNVSAGNIGITAYVTVVFYLARQAGQADSKTAEPTAHGPRALAGKAATEGGHA